MEALEAGRITSLELLDAHIRRFKSVNRHLNAIIKTDIERARERANALDGKRADGNVLGPLHGLPMTIKDTLDVDNMPASAGAPQYASRSRPVPDADVVRRLKAAGAVIWGKTNVPYLASDWQSGNKLSGATNNPYDLTRTPGGSSGGAAASLASGMTPLEVGSDIGGSLRIPAHFTGVCSLKPTYGVISQYGHIPPAPEYRGEVDLNVVGPMARTVRDLKLLRSVIQHGATQGGRPNLHLHGVRLAVWPENEGWPLDREITDILRVASHELDSIGADMTMAMPDLDPDELIDVYLSLLIPVTAMEASNLEMMGIRTIRPVLKLLQSFSKNPFTARNWAIKASQTHVEWMQADGRRAALKGMMRAFFESYDALIMPVSPTPAFEHKPRGNVLSRKLDVNGEKVPYGTHLTWIALATACHLPVVTIPMGRTREGLPVGMQIIGAQGEDARILDIAEACESVFGGFRRPPSDLGLL
ncbi:amidase family protein [Ponticaulis profundi]|uniref:Amidase family protein n=1 Tax=Ponticaulis profundi TaxID=2665222 RepID=A0ABW1S8W1_9PROT